MSPRCDSQVEKTSKRGGKIISSAQIERQIEDEKRKEQEERESVANLLKNPTKVLLFIVIVGLSWDGGFKKVVLIRGTKYRMKYVYHDFGFLHPPVVVQFHCAGGKLLLSPYVDDRPYWKGSFVLKSCVSQMFRSHFSSVVVVVF